MTERDNVSVITETFETSDSGAIPMIRRLSILFLAFYVLTFIPLASQSLQAEPTAREVVNQMDQKTRGNTSQGLMELQIDRDRVHRSLLMQIWDESSTDRAFIRVLKPERR